MPERSPKAVRRKSARPTITEVGGRVNREGIAWDPKREVFYIGHASRARQCRRFTFRPEKSSVSLDRRSTTTYYGGVDGLIWAKGRLFGVQNAIGDLRIWSAEVTPQGLAAPKLLSSGDPRLGSVTTAALNPAGLWLIADTQFRRYGPDGEVLGEDQLPFLQLFRIPIASSSTPRGL